MLRYNIVMACLLLVSVQSGPIPGAWRWDHPQCPDGQLSGQYQIALDEADISPHPAFHEISGLVVSHHYHAEVLGNPYETRWSDIGYVINDSGGPRLAAFNMRTGARLKTWVIQGTGVLNIDWEDIALGPCSAGEPRQIHPDSTHNPFPPFLPSTPKECLFIGDVGDNNARIGSGTTGRTNYRIYKFLEPNPLGQNPYVDGIISVESVMQIDYKHANSPTDYADVESMFVDPVGDTQGGQPGDLYLVTKWMRNDLGKTRLFKFPVNNQYTNYSPFSVEPQPASVRLQGSNYGGQWTAPEDEGWTRADILPNGRLIAVAGYGWTQFWARDADTTVSGAMVATANECQWVFGTHCDQPLQGCQYEALAWVRRTSDRAKWSLAEIQESTNPKIRLTAIDVPTTYSDPTPAPTPAPAPTIPPPTPAPTVVCFLRKQNADGDVTTILVHSDTLKPVSDFKKKLSTLRGGGDPADCDIYQ